MKEAYLNLDGIPCTHFSGSEGNYNVLALELLGPNLESLMSAFKNRLSQKTVLMIADQLVSISF
jgi:hypothetical protein